MQKTTQKHKPVSAEAIARIAEQGGNVSRFFTGKGKMMPPIQRVNVDFTAPMLNELRRSALAAEKGKSWAGSRVANRRG